MVVQETLEQYHQHSSLGSSMLKIMLESPKLYKAHFIDKKIERKETHALHFGSAIHLALLEPKVFLERYAVEPEVRRNTNAYKEWRDAVLESDPKAIILSKDDMDNLQGMVESVMAHPEAASMLRKGVPERSIYQDVTVEGPDHPPIVLKGKARPDYLHENGDLIEVKSCRDAGFAAFRRQIWDLRYDVSAAYHRHLVELEYGRKDDRYFWWVAIEKACPWDVCVYRANDMVLDRGEGDFRKALWRFNQCTTTGKWPGKQEHAQDIDLPARAQNE